jgi:pyruvate dehydrogenase E2 component (dihydrolipoamide acetyltransferase)
MAEVVKMPKMSDTMTEGVMAKWHVKVGDKVKSGDVMAEVETDKATMDLESYWDGTILYIGVEEGKAVPVDAVIAVVGKEGEDYKAALDAEGTPAAPAAEKAAAEPAQEKPVETEKATIPAAPAATGAALSDADIEKMGVTVVRMPLLSDTMTEGVIAEWHKKVGDKIKEDDILADVETDKATMEVMGYAEGTLLHIGVEKGQAAKVNGIIATDAAAPVAEKEPEVAPEETASVSADGSRLKASPLAKRIAKEKGIDLSKVSGSADGGRIIKKDIENFKPAAAAPQAAEASAPATEKPAAALPQFIGEEKFTEKPVSQMRKVIAKRLSESLFTSPHFYLTMSIDMDSAIAARAKMNDFAPVKISFNDMVIKAVAVALKQHPNVNSSWLGDKIRYNEHVNIGVAVAVEDGLLVPVVRFADGKTLSRISAEVKDFAQRAKAKKLQPSDWEGSTFTISNLGMFGIDEFTAIINPPDACILAIGGIAQVPVVKNGAVVPGNVMKVTLSCDHRVVDGATGSAFLQTFKALLEEPVRLLV